MAKYDLYVYSKTQSKLEGHDRTLITFEGSSQQIDLLEKIAKSINEGTLLQDMRVLLNVS